MRQDGRKYSLSLCLSWSRGMGIFRMGLGLLEEREYSEFEAEVGGEESAAEERWLES